MEDGHVLEVERPKTVEMDTSKTFLVELPITSWKIRQMNWQIKKITQTVVKEGSKYGDEFEDIEVDEPEWEIGPILCAIYKLKGDSFYVSAGNAFKGVI